MAVVKVTRFILNANRTKPNLKTVAKNRETTEKEKNTQSFSI